MTPFSRHNPANYPLLKTRSHKNESGAVLFVALMLLMALTVFVISMANMSDTQFKVIANQQEQKRLDAVARQAMETALSDGAWFDSTVAAAITGSAVSVFTCTSGCTGCGASVKTMTINGYTACVTAPGGGCYGGKTAPGYSALSSVSPDDNHFELVAIVSDPSSGASAEVRQGVKVRMGQNTCTIF